MTESCLHTISNQKKKEEQAEQLSLTSIGSRSGPVNELVITKLTERVIHPTPFMLLDNTLITLSQRSLEVRELQRDFSEPPTAPSAPLLAAPQRRALLPAMPRPLPASSTRKAALDPRSPTPNLAPGSLRQPRLRVLQSNQGLYHICRAFYPETWGNSVKKSNQLCMKEHRNNERGL